MRLYAGQGGEWGWVLHPYSRFLNFHESRSHLSLSLPIYLFYIVLTSSPCKNSSKGEFFYYIFFFFKNVSALADEEGGRAYN